MGAKNTLANIITRIDHRIDQAKTVEEYQKIETSIKLLRSQAKKNREQLNAKKICR